jgi:hypothetical protein
MSSFAVAESASPGASRITPCKDLTASPPADWRYHAILLAICAGVLLMAAVLSVRDRSQVVLPLIGLPLPELCTMRRLVGIDCPGCGLTRCFISLAHGNWRDAWSYNPAGLWLFALVLLQLPYRGFQLWRIARGQREIALPWMTVVAFVILAVALLGQWSLRLAGMLY